MRKAAYRDPGIDALKGLAILLVLLGHAIQYTAPSEAFWQHPLFCGIYSFHMPFFIFLSGLVVGFSKPKDFLPTLRQRSRSLLLPYFSWSVVTTSALFLVDSSLRHAPPPPLSKLVLAWIRGEGLWFLWVLFLLALLVPLAERIALRIGIPLTAVLFAVGLPWIPHSSGMLFQFCWLSPFFFLSWAMGRRWGSAPAHSFSLWSVVPLMFALCFFLQFWQTEDFVYWNLFTGSLVRILFRYLVACVGIGAILAVLPWLHRLGAEKGLARLGYVSLDLYVVQSLLMPLIGKLPRPHGNVQWNLIWIPVVFVTVTLLSLLMAKGVLRRNTLLALVFLGVSQKRRKEKSPESPGLLN